MMAGVKILKLGPGVGDGRIRRVAPSGHAGGVDGRVLRAGIGDLATVRSPSVGDRMLRVETGARGGDLHRVWRKNRVRRSRGRAGKWRVVVAAQVQHQSCRQADAVPLCRVPRQEPWVVVVVNVVYLQRAEAEHMTQVYIEATAGTHSGTPFGNVVGTVPSCVVHSAHKNAHKRRENLTMILVLQATQNVGHVDVVYAGIRNAAIEVVTEIGKDAQVVRLGKVIGVGKIEATRYIGGLETIVDIATCVQPGVAAKDLVYWLNGLRRCKRAAQAQSAGKRD